MRISKQISGNATRRDESDKQGRGEYEWCELTAYDPARRDLLNRRIHLSLPDGITLDTGCILGKSGGKWRVRVDPDLGRRREIYPHYHVAAAMLMPRPSRQEQDWGGGLPVMRNREYSIVDIQLGRTVLSGDTVAILDVSVVTIQNQWAGDELQVADRLGRVQTVWRDRGRLPDDLAALVEAHEQLVRHGGIISQEGLELVERIQIATAGYSRDMPGILGVSSVGDPLPVLLQMVGVDTAPEPIPIDQIPTELTEVRRREIKNRRTVAARGSEAVRFRIDVRSAYNSTCLVCGHRLPSCGPGSAPGVDSCHILPYSDFDINTTANGLCLCKLHHWAFDEGLIELRSTEHGGYEVAIPDEIVGAAETAGFSMQWLRGQACPVPIERLPRNRSDWPNPDFLSKLREILFPTS